MKQVSNIDRLRHVKHEVRLAMTAASQDATSVMAGNKPEGRKANLESVEVALRIIQRLESMGVKD